MNLVIQFTCNSSERWHFHLFSDPFIYPTWPVNAPSFPAAAQAISISLLWAFSFGGRGKSLITRAVNTAALVPKRFHASANILRKKKNQSKNPKKSKMSLYMIREDAALAACKAYQARVHPGTIKFEFLQICWGRAKRGQGEASSRRLRRLASSQARTLRQIRETVCHDAYTKDLLICLSLARNECRRRGPTTSNQTAERHRNRVFFFLFQAQMN